MYAGIDHDETDQTSFHALLNKMKVSDSMFFRAEYF